MKYSSWGIYNTTSDSTIFIIQRKLSYNHLKSSVIPLTKPMSPLLRVLYFMARVHVVYESLHYEGPEPKNTHICPPTTPLKCFHKI